MRVYGHTFLKGEPVPSELTADELSPGAGRELSESRALSETVASYLREQIISGKLQRGEFLRIESIAKALNVSTTPVREGLLLLQNESFVRLIPRRGFVVNTFTKRDIFDMFWAEATVGAELAARSAATITADDIAHLEELLEAHVKASAAGDEELILQIGHQFHRTINLAAQSPRLALLAGSLARQLPRRFVKAIRHEAVEYHRNIISALRAGDAEAVRFFMFRHTVSGAEDVIAMLERSGTWGPAPIGEQHGDTYRKAPQAPKNGAPKVRRQIKGVSSTGSAVRVKDGAA